MSVFLGRAACAFAASLLLVLLLVGMPAPAQSLSGNPFPVQPMTLFLTGERGGAAAGGASDVLLLQPDLANTDSQTLFLLPGVDVLGLIQGQDRELWYQPQAQNRTMEYVGDAHITLHFLVQAEATAIFQVNLYSAGSDGILHIIGSQSRQFVSVLSDPVTFEIPMDGAVIPKGHSLVLEVYAESASALVTLQYDAADTPSAIDLLNVRPLDSDADGVPDSDEVARGLNPLFPDSDDDGVVDGGEDDDGDGLINYYEYRYFYDAADADTDDDGIPDGQEDCDRDGLTNAQEAARGTDLCDADTDDDGIPDGQDSTPGRDPVTPPGRTPGGGSGVAGLPPEPVLAAGVFASTSALTLLVILRRF